MPKILLVGQDYRLLTTRAAVLAKTDASIVYGNMAQALEILESEAFDLVVLCHSLAEEQTTEIANVVHRRWPKTRILMVVSDVSQERRYKGVDFDGISSPDPNRLIRRTAELLEESSHYRIKEPRRMERHQIAS